MERNYPSYDQLLSELGTSNINYDDLLSTTEWRNRRNEIVSRDKCICTNCGKSETIHHHDERLWKHFNLWIEIDGIEDSQYVKGLGTVLKPKNLNITASSKPFYLHVHHKYYVINRLPWEYKDSALVTLCNWCHWELHKNEKVQVYLEDGVTVANYNLCIRCNGAGWFPEYKHVEGGVCFKCRGSRFDQPLIFNS